MGSNPAYAAPRPPETPAAVAAASLPLVTLIRFLAGGMLAWCVITASTAPEMPRVAGAAALAVLALSVWRAAWGLLCVVALAPAGALFAAAPARSAELFAWSLLAGWLLPVWRPLSRAPWPRQVVIPAALYGAAVLASWVTLTISGAAGVPPVRVPGFLVQSLSQDHLIFSAVESETWTTIQTVTMLAVMLAAVGSTRTDVRVVRRLAWTIVISAGVLGLATVTDVIRQWADAGYAMWFLARYTSGERFSLHMADLNAAGSLSVLAGLTGAALATFDRRRGGLWVALLAMMLPALWLTGSRAAVLAAVAVGAVVLRTAARHRRWAPTAIQRVAAAALVIVVLAATVVVATRRDERGDSPARSMQLRWQFYQTSAGMVGAAPMYGVGVGRYFTRSSEFMPAELRALYGNENAHNYFVQQFAELGLVGGALFIWLVVPTVVRGWRIVRSSEAGEGVMAGLFAGAAAYLVTCMTGHPLLVPEAALPFWAAFGVLGAITSDTSGVSSATRIASLIVVFLLIVHVGGGAATYVRTTMAPAEQGFHAEETAEDGTRFRWMTRHGVTYIPGEPGFMRLRLRAPDDRASERPLVVETAIGGRVVDRREVPPGRWVAYDIAVREPAREGFRRVDLRASQFRTQEVQLGRRAARRPISVMVGEIGWTPLSALP